MAKSIITIGRQYGSGGREIGQRLAEKLGIKCYDSELLDKTAEFTKNVTENAEEKEPESHETVYGGDWLDIKCSDGTSIYYEARESNYVRIGAKTYYTSDDTAKEFKEYVIDFLENGGYWG